MLKSMTGYGEATAEGKNFVISVELKSVNNRFFKIVSKIPEEVSYLQNDVEEQVRRSVPRGSVSLTVRFTPTRYADLYEIDPEVLKKYLKTLNVIRDELNSSEEIRIKDLLMLPGVIHGEEALVLGKEAVLPVALRALEEAVEKLTRMRSLEGSSLEAEFQERSRCLRTLLGKVKAEAPRALAEYQQKLEERVNLLLSQKGVTIAPEDLLKEVAILAERSDIAEEIQRFSSHLDQFVASLNEERPVGRKLEFIVQEMFRESNTMSAKSSNTALNQSIVEIKAEVDRLKEQVVNVE
ncbi:MAG: YicC family protein [Planctomycetes bacterium]|nr:YicC family protein [Planctomycetota bacterium]